MIDFRLRMIEAEINFPELDVVIKSLEPMRFLSLFVESIKKVQNPKAFVVGVRKKAIIEGVIQHTGVTIDVSMGK